MTSIPQDNLKDTAGYIHKGKFGIEAYFDEQIKKTIIIMFSENRSPFAMYASDFLSEKFPNIPSIPDYWKNLPEEERQKILHDDGSEVKND